MNTKETTSNYTQLCVWEGTAMGEGSPEDFENFMKDIFNVRIKFMEEVKTLPGQGGEGNRPDLFFYVHSDDLSRFAVARFQAGIRWWEDVLGNIRADNRDMIYSDEILEKYPTTGSYAG